MLQNYSNNLIQIHSNVRTGPMSQPTRKSKLKKKIHTHAQTQSALLRLHLVLFYSSLIARCLQGPPPQRVNLFFSGIFIGIIITDHFCLWNRFSLIISRAIYFDVAPAVLMSLPCGHLLSENTIGGCLNKYIYINNSKNKNKLNVSKWMRNRYRS